MRLCKIARELVGVHAVDMLEAQQGAALIPHAPHVRVSAKPEPMRAQALLVCFVLDPYD